MKDIQSILTEKQASIEELWAVYDQLDVVPTNFMIGQWRGEEIASGHPWDGLLTAVGWYGKEFIDEEVVHPLIFSNSKQTRFLAGDPKFIPLTLPTIVFRMLAPVARVFIPFIKTRTPAACLRMIEHRGKKTATMVYHKKPIQDSFRRINDNQVLGVMDFKKQPRPYFFILTRIEKKFTIVS